MAILSSDAFTGTNWSQIAGTTDDQGNVWTRDLPNYPSRFYVHTNRLYYDLGGYTYPSGITFPSADYYAELDLINLSNLGIVGPSVRHVVGQATGYSFYNDPSTGRWTLVRIVLNSTTVLANSTIQTLSTGGTVYTARVEAEGSQIRAYVNGTMLYDVTDASPITDVGVPALWASGSGITNTNGRQVDNWLVGSIDPPAPVPGIQFSAHFS